MTSGKVQTVLGQIDPNDLGITYPHEHLSMTFEVAYKNPPLGDENKVNWDFKMHQLGWIRQYPYSHWPNLRLVEERDAVLEEVKIFKANGGGTIVENSSIGLNRDIEYVRNVAKQTGVNVVAGTGYYVDGSLTAEVKAATVETLAGTIVKEVEHGVDDTGIRCGVIGELGCSWPLTPAEKKVLQAGAQAQSVLGCPVIIHPGRNHEAPDEIVRILQEAGGDISKTVMSHLDRTFHCDEDLLEYARLGSYLSYDMFGIETSMYQPNVEVDMPSDAERIRRIAMLIENGYLDRIVLAHDIHTKHRLVKYGGHGFSHILTVILPMMKRRGYTRQSIDTMLIDNPKAWLTFK